MKDFPHFRSVFYNNIYGRILFSNGCIVIGNSTFVHKRATINFFDGLTWLCQLIMFLILIARPASVFVCLAPFKRSFKEKLFISWVGLKGAAPIIFAIMLLTAGTPDAAREFNIVFMCTLERYKQF